MEDKLSDADINGIQQYNNASPSAINNVISALNDVGVKSSQLKVGGSSPQTKNDAISKKAETLASRIMSDKDKAGKFSRSGLIDHLWHY